MAVLCELRPACSLQREAGNSNSACLVLPTLSWVARGTQPLPSSHASTRCDFSCNRLSHPPALTSRPCDIPIETWLVGARRDNRSGSSIQRWWVKEKNSVWSPVTTTSPSFLKAGNGTSRPRVVVTGFWHRPPLPPWPGEQVHVGLACLKISENK